MSFWKNFGFHSASTIDTLLEEKGADLTLEELMDEPELIQECKSQNRKLIEFCTKRPQLEKIVHYVADVPDSDSDEKHKEKYPMLCTEILCAEVWQFSDAIYNEKDLLTKLYAFLDKDPKNMTVEERKVGDNCARTISSLLLRKGTETLNFLRSYPDVVKKFVHHVCNTNILDYIVKLISADEYYSVSDDPTSDGLGVEDRNAVTWLCDEHFVDLIVEKFIDETDQETQESASMMLYELTTYFSSQCDSPLIQRLESQEIVDKLFNYITTTVSLLPSHYYHQLSSPFAVAAATAAAVSTVATVVLSPFRKSHVFHTLFPLEILLTTRKTSLYNALLSSPDIYVLQLLLFICRTP